MTNLNKELNNLKYTFKKYEELEDYKANALDLTKDNKLNQFYESTNSDLVKEADTYIDSFFLNSTDLILDRTYILDEQYNLHVKFLLLNNSQINKMTVVLVKNLNNKNVEDFEKRYSQDQAANEAVNKDEILEKLNEIKDYTETLENIKSSLGNLSNYNDSEIKSIVNAIKDKVNTLENANLESLNSELQAIKQLVNAIPTNVSESVDYTSKLNEISSKIDNISVEGSSSVESSGSDSQTGEITKNDVNSLLKILKNDTREININLTDIATEEDIIKKVSEKNFLGVTPITINKFYKSTLFLKEIAEEKYKELGIIEYKKDSFKAKYHKKSGGWIEIESAINLRENWDEMLNFFEINKQEFSYILAMDDVFEDKIDTLFDMDFNVKRVNGSVSFYYNYLSSLVNYITNSSAHFNDISNYSMFIYESRKYYLKLLKNAGELIESYVMFYHLNSFQTIFDYTSKFITIED